jgi:hypothetical protein
MGEFNKELDIMVLDSVYRRPERFRANQKVIAAKKRKRCKR